MLLLSVVKPEARHLLTGNDSCALSFAFCGASSGSTDTAQSISNGYKRFSGHLKILFEDLEGTLISAPLTYPSAPSNNLSTLAIFQSPRECASLCTNTMSPCLVIVFTLCRWHSLNSLLSIASRSVASSY